MKAKDAKFAQVLARVEQLETLNYQLLSTITHSDHRKSNFEQ